jgi:perosamine synthetase
MDHRACYQRAVGIRNGVARLLCRLTDIACALGLSRLKKLEANLRRRREIAARYKDAFRGLAGVVPPAVRADVTPAWHLYPVQLNLKRLTADRTRVFRALRAENIGVNVH